MIVNNIINFYFFRVIQHNLFKGTRIEFSDQVFYSCLPLVGGPTFTMGPNTGRLQGRTFEPGTFMDIRDIMHIKSRYAYVLESGYTFCFALTDTNVNWKYVNGNNTVIPPNTHAFVASGNIAFEDKGQQKEAKMLNLINRRPYELNTVGQSELILIP